MSQTTHSPSVLDSETHSTETNPAAPVELEPELQFDLSQDVSAAAMDSNADGLMNLLFADVDRMLRDGVELPIEPPQPEAPPPILPIESILPQKLSPRDLIPQSIEPEETAIAATPDSEAVPEAVVPSKKGWNPIWWAILLSSLLLSAGMLSYLFRAQLTQVWLALLTQYANTDTPVAKPSADPKAQENADFLDYLGRALDRIAHRQTEVAEAEVKPSPVVSPPPVVAASPNIVERVYVPIYPPQSSPAAPAPVPAPAANTPAVKPAPAISPAPAPSPAAPAIPNIAANNNHMLLGVMELGERSAALFEVNGIPQRIEIGAPIGSSGWSLVSISNQEAIVRRNGEVRSIYVGQKF